MTSAGAWTVNVPIDDLLSLMRLKDDLDRVLADNKQLRREMDGLRCVQSESMQILGDLRQICNRLTHNY